MGRSRMKKHIIFVKSLFFFRNQYCSTTQSVYNSLYHHKSNTISCFRKKKTLFLSTSHSTNVFVFSPRNGILVLDIWVKQRKHLSSVRSIEKVFFFFFENNWGYSIYVCINCCKPTGLLNNIGFGKKSRLFTTIIFFFIRERPLNAPPW